MQENDGRHVVTIHGYGFDPRIWAPVELAFDGFGVHHLGLPGFGRAPENEPYSIVSLADSYWQELDEAGIRMPHLVGHSMGGYVVLAMAARRPGSISSVTLVHSHAAADPPEKKRARDITIAGIRQHGRDYILDRLIPSVFPDATTWEPIIRQLRNRVSGVSEASWIAGSSAMRDREDNLEILRSLPCPVHFVAGLKDAAVSPTLVLAQAALPERTKLSVYPDAGHMSMYECPGRLMVDMMDFLAWAVG